ncbi:hypothetical protein RFI_03499 [Reticulomyxa filosa]|uniref:Uncharacterized protein n=1 Tax=Reticulomyxa filosa TaxID=46433 RepID=X6P662_RETFI|nr:hypothetical protein RFI_03499 [Reticulomyxa filosa]|eukprot:ETO33603.1 hypothetical protein RFI_03499 [Reticulomyxa filosa]
MYRCINFEKEDPFLVVPPSDASDYNKKELANNEKKSSDAQENKEEDQEEVNEETVNVDNMATTSEKNPNKAVGKIIAREHYTKDLLVRSSGAYRPGVVYMDIKGLDEGVYIAIISTFEPNQIGGFKFTVRSNQRIGFTPV